MARVLVSLDFAWAIDGQGYVSPWPACGEVLTGLTIVIHFMRSSMYYICWAVDLETRPLLHSRAIYVLFLMLSNTSAIAAQEVVRGCIHRKSSRILAHREGSRSS